MKLSEERVFETSSESVQSESYYGLFACLTPKGKGS